MLAKPVAASVRPLLITGSARSGTLYVTTILRAAGIDAGHERAVSVRRWRQLQPGEVEVSWLAAPLRLRAYTVHQVRHPLATVASLLGRGAFEPSHRRSRWGRYAARFLPGLLDEPTSIDRVCRYYIEWNALVRADVRWRIEDVTDAAIGAVTGLGEAEVAAARARVPAAMHQSRPPGLGWDDIPARYRARLKELTAEYGYPAELPAGVDRPRSATEAAATDYLAWLQHVRPEEFRRWPEPASFVLPAFSEAELEPRFADEDLAQAWMFLDRAERDSLLHPGAVARRRKQLLISAAGKARGQAEGMGEAVEHLRRAFGYAPPAGAKERLTYLALRNERLALAALGAVGRVRRRRRSAA